jgi:threonine/homoserine/homoserine lactone efflux protein
MDHFSLLKGIIFGISIAAPVGPIGILCIRRTLSAGMCSGFVSGLGAATADAIYGSIAAFGLTLISNILIQQRFYIHTIGSLFLLYLGWKTFWTAPSIKSTNVARKGILACYASTFFLTITNPMTIISFTAVFAGLGAGNVKGDYFGTTLLVTGVFTGSMLWWLLLGSGISAFRNKFNIQSMKWINRLSGIIIIGFALFNFYKMDW